MGIRIKAVQKLIDINERIIFYPKLRRFYSKALIKDRPIILDVGMNKGQSIAFFKSLAKSSEIHGFEPNPMLFKALENKYGSDSSIKLNNVGASNSTGKLTFYENIMDETSSFEPLNYESDYLLKKAKVLGVDPTRIVKSEYPVSVIRLADYIAEQNLNKIDLVKIDTEGHEKCCLEGLFSRPLNCHIEYIQLEQHNDDMYKQNVKSEEIVELLQSSGFHERIRIKHGFGDFYEIVYQNQQSK